MRILFLHPNFPSQFRDLCAALGSDKRNQVVFGTTVGDHQIPGVAKAVYKLARTPKVETHPYLRNLETQILHGQAVARMLLSLKEKGFVPDVVYGHSGWGPTLFIKDVAPKAKLLCSFEWFYRSRGSDCDFDPSEPLKPDDEARIRMKNSGILLDLESSDAGTCPTVWQKEQFPKEFHHKLTTVHEGIDTDFFKPVPGAKLKIPRINFDLSHAKEIVTYVARGMEPYRGFPQFIESVHHLLKMRPETHVVVLGDDRVAYGKPAPDGKTFKQLLLEKYPLDSKRVHFPGSLPYGEYVQVLQASDVHIYLTRPFVLSWSMMEAMSAGCLLVASDTAPVCELIDDEFNGLLVDFFDTEAIARKVSYALDNKERMKKIRAKARETILHRYRLQDLVARRIEWINRELAKP